MQTKNPIPLRSHLIAEASKLIAEKHGKNIVVAYADPAGGEVGTIYSAVNFLYTGMTTGTERFRTPDGKIHDGRQVSGLTRDRRNGELKYKRSRSEQKKLLLEQGCEFLKEGSKHRFVHFAGDRRTKRILRKSLKWKILPPPKRAVTRQQFAFETGAAVEQIEKSKATSQKEPAEQPQKQITEQTKKPLVREQRVARGYHWEERIIGNSKMFVILDGKNKYYERYPLDAIGEMQADLAKLTNQAGI